MSFFAYRLLKDYSDDSDHRIAYICRSCMFLIFAVIILNVLHVFKISTALYPTLIISAVILLLPTLFYDILHLRSKFIRYLFLLFWCLCLDLCILFCPTM